MTTTTTTLPRLGVGAVILNEQNEILLVWRNRNPEKDTWCIPGGKVDPYEKLEDCVIREIKEEVDLEVEVKELLCTSETIRPENNEHWVSAIYAVTVKSGEARNMEPGGAIGDLKWFPLNQLPDNLACFMLPAIDSLKKKGM